METEETVLVTVSPAVHGIPKSGLISNNASEQWRKTVIPILVRAFWIFAQAVCVLIYK